MVNKKDTLYLEDSEIFHKGKLIPFVEYIKMAQRGELPSLDEYFKKEGFTNAKEKNRM